MGESNLAFITRESVSRAEPLSSPPGLKDALSDLQRGNRERRGEAAPVISSKAEGPTDAAPAVHGHAATLSSAIPEGIFVASLLWWRFYTFYLYILVGGLAAGDAALRALRPAPATLSPSAPS